MDVREFVVGFHVWLVTSVCTYIHTYIIYLFTQVEIRQHKADVDLRLIKFTNLEPNKPSKI